MWFYFGENAHVDRKIDARFGRRLKAPKSTKVTLSALSADTTCEQQCKQDNLVANMHILNRV
jgi:hypothetical protein